MIEFRDIAGRTVFLDAMEIIEVCEYTPDIWVVHYCSDGECWHLVSAAMAKHIATQVAQAGAAEPEDEHDDADWWKKR